MKKKKGGEGGNARAYKRPSVKSVYKGKKNKEPKKRKEI